MVINYSSSREAAERVVSEIASDGGKAIAVKANVAKQADIERLFAETKAAFGALDILVNNAGIYAAAPVGTITEEGFHRHFDLNVLGLILASQEAAKHFGPEGGVIVNVSSIVAILSPAGTAVHNATKGAVDAVTRTFSRELSSRGIRVNPGLVATEGLHASGFLPGGEPPPAVGRVAKPEDIAADRCFPRIARFPLDQWSGALRHR